MKLKKNSKGIALLLVLSAIMLMSAAGIDLAYNMNTAHHLASNELDRLQAQYLAQSAVQLTLLELKYDKVFQQVVQQQNLSEMLGQAANQPLCKQFPLSTGLIRTLSSSILTEGAEGVSAPIPEESEDADTEASESGTGLSNRNFLDFEGDFDAECEDEATKFNLNVFATLNPEEKFETGGSEYSLYKAQLAQLFKAEKYKDLFELSNVRPEEAVRNIADWVDENSQINELDGSAAGAEESLYGGTKFKIKNDKLSTLDELSYVAGVSDNWLPTLRSRLTIYGDGKVNICAAEEDIVRAVIERVVGSLSEIPPIRLADEEVMKRLSAAVTDACTTGGSGESLRSALAQKLLAAIAFEAGLGTDNSALPLGSNEKVLGVLSTKSRYFRVKAAGQVRDMTVRIDAVVDTQADDPTKWAFVYWKEY